MSLFHVFSGVLLIDPKFIRHYQKTLGTRVSCETGTRARWAKG